MDPCLQLPPTLSKIKLFIPLIWDKPSFSYIDFWVATLNQDHDKSFNQLDVVVTYHPNAADLIGAVNRSITQLDKAFAEHAEYLYWVDVLVPPLYTDIGPGDSQEVAKLDDWLFETAFARVSKKFFAGMPIPTPGDRHTSAIATRYHQSYIREPKDEKDEENSEDEEDSEDEEESEDEEDSGDEEDNEDNEHEDNGDEQ